MQLLLAVLLISIGIGALFFLMALAMRWVSGFALRDFSRYLRSAESIVERETLPEEWLASHRRRLARLRQIGKSEQEIDRAGRQAQADILKKIDALLYFFEKANVTDRPETRQTIRQSLQTFRARIVSSAWPALFDAVDSSQKSS